MKLLMEGTSFSWNDRCEESFWEVKKRLTTLSILTLPGALREYYGGVVMQEDNVISYNSRYHRPQDNYTTNDLELAPLFLWDKI